MRRALLAPIRFFRRNHSALLVLAACGTMWGLAAFSGFWLFYRAAYVIGGLAVISFVWARANLYGLEVTVERAADRLQVGQSARARIRLASRTFYPKLWLEVEDPTDMPGAPVRAVVTLPAHGHRNWKVSAVCSRRGVFTAGPVRVTTGDPFGLFRFTRAFGVEHPLVVMPLPEEVPQFSAPPAQLPGEGTVRRLIHYVTPNAASIREYGPGDSYNRIHWPSTARTGRLMVKTFEMDPSSDISVLLDLHGDVQAGEGDDSTEEYAVRAAASIAHHFLEANRMLGMLAFGRETVLLDPARGPRQYQRILEALALARAEGDIPLDRVLRDHERRFGRNTTVIVVTPSAQEDWVTSLQALVQRGSRAAVVLMDPGSFGGSGNALLPYSTLVASDVLTYLVRRGDDLALALGPAGITGAGLAAKPGSRRR